MLREKRGIGDYCSNCGRPEDSNYECSPNATFTCSKCVQIMLAKDAEEKEESKKPLVKRPKRRTKL